MTNRKPVFLKDGSAFDVVENPSLVDYMSKLDKAVCWAYSEEADEFVNTGVLRGVKYKDSDLLKSFEFYLKDVFGYRISEEICNFSAGEIPTEEELLAVMDFVERENLSYVEPEDIKKFSYFQKKTLEDLGVLLNARERNLFFTPYIVHGETEYEDKIVVYDLDNNSRIDIDAYELSVAACGDQNFYKMLLVDGLKESDLYKRDENLAKFKAYAICLPDLAKFFVETFEIEYK